MDGTQCATHHGRATLIKGGGKSFHTVPLDKKNVFTLHTVSGYTALITYCATVGYDLYLHDDKSNYIPGKLSIFSRPVANIGAKPSPNHPYPTPKGEI